VVKEFLGKTALHVVPLNEDWIILFAAYTVTETHFAF